MKASARWSRSSPWPVVSRRRGLAKSVLAGWRSGLVFAVAACASPVAPTLAESWGGTDASMTVTLAGGSIQYACGSGSIGADWHVDRRGVLQATGWHFIGGGTVPEGGRPPHPATYVGRIRGNAMTLTVSVTDLGQVLGPFELIRNGAVVHELCDAPGGP